MKLLIFFLPIFMYAITFSVTILPQKGVIEAIAKDKVKVNVMVPPGNSPATYSPNFKQIKLLKSSYVYFTIGVPFDKKYITKFEEINPKLKVVDFSKYIKHSNNPHIWLSPVLLTLQAKAVLDELIKIDAKNRVFYTKNFYKFIEKLNSLEKKGLTTISQHSFLTFHPSFYYFAKDFYIKEIAIEKDGKKPSFKSLQHIIEIAKHQQIKTVIISPEFPEKYARIVADKIGAKVKIISPLNENPLQTINELIEVLK